MKVYVASWCRYWDESSKKQCFTCESKAQVERAVLKMDPNAMKIKVEEVQ
jgi:hypothetical protein